MKVLIADDDPTYRIVLEETIAEWGYETCTVADGLEAKQALEQDNAPRLAILDWMMPGMNGPELCRCLRQSDKAQYTYTILLTSKSEKKDVLLGMDSGADAFLTKPVDFEELMSRLAAGKRILEHQARLSLVDIKKKTCIESAVPAQEIAGVDSVKIQRILESTTDLTRDSLLAPAPRIVFGDRLVPMLGKTLILNKIGEGGMGAVYRGFNPRFQREVAVKVLTKSVICQQSIAVARFYREAKIAALIKSDHLVTVAELDQAHGLVYVVMELIDGLTAFECLKRKMAADGSALPEAEVLEICIAAAKGLAAAHEGGIVHRDVKPDNILVPYNDTRTGMDRSAAKLADLGIARHELDYNSITETNSSLGTAGYMAPEQICDAKHAGKPADIFGLGATLYVLLSGRAPFPGNSTLDILNSTIYCPHKSIRLLRDDISQTTAAIIDVCLAKRPEARFPDVSVLLKDLIYCRRLLDTRKPSATDKTSITLPRVLERPTERTTRRGLRTAISQ